MHANQQLVLKHLVVPLVDACRKWGTSEQKEGGKEGREEGGEGRREGRMEEGRGGSRR